MTNIGRIFSDASVDHMCVYAVGRDGFLDLVTGVFIQYDSAFSGPEFFDQEAFEEWHL